MNQFLGKVYDWLYTLLHHRALLRDRSAEIVNLRKKVDGLYGKLHELEVYFYPPMTDVEWADRVAKFAGRIQREQQFTRNHVEAGQLQGIAAELVALLTRIGVSLKAGDINTVHAWLQGPQRPATHAQRHNDVLTTIEEMRRAGELSDQSAWGISKQFNSIFFMRTKGYIPGESLIIDAEEEKPDQALLSPPPKPKRVRKPKGKVGVKKARIKPDNH